MHQKIIVTGGLGFLGSHLVRTLVGQGHAVLVVDPSLDNPASRLGVDPSVVCPGSGTSWGSLFARPGHVEYIRGRGRYLSTVDLDGHIDDGHIDVIYHLGADASPPAYKTDPFESLWSGSLDTHAVVRVAQLHGARVVLASTSEVYGDPTVSPQPESYRGNVDPVGPRSMYDEAKRYAEAYLAAFIREGGDGRIARIFNTFGPGMKLDDGRMIPEFIRACIEDRPIPLHGTGSQTRTLCYVDDLIDGLIKLGNAGKPSNLDAERRPVPWPVNLGGAEEVAVGDIADEVRIAWKRVTGREAPDIRFTRQPCPQDPKHRRPDITRARDWLRWQPTTDWKTGIERTIRHFVKKV